jgi:hypothetical protein
MELAGCRQYRHLRSPGAHGGPAGRKQRQGHPRFRTRSEGPGHDFEQTEGKGINVYTHGEMLPCHGYPELKKYSHFYGHYGTAWQNQAKEFAAFPGAIVMTTNCIQKPRESYQDNIFTTGLVGWPGVTHIVDKDFTPAIDRALECPASRRMRPARRSWSDLPETPLWAWRRR